MGVVAIVIVVVDCGGGCSVCFGGTGSLHECADLCSHFLDGDVCGCKFAGEASDLVRKTGGDSERDLFHQYFHRFPLFRFFEFVKFVLLSLTRFRRVWVGGEVVAS